MRSKTKGQLIGAKGKKVTERRQANSGAAEVQTQTEPQAFGHKNNHRLFTINSLRNGKINDQLLLIGHKNNHLSLLINSLRNGKINDQLLLIGHKNHHRSLSINSLETEKQMMIYMTQNNHCLLTIHTSRIGKTNYSAITQSFIYNSLRNVKTNNPH